jgi:hypothetical protein
MFRRISTFVFSFLALSVAPSAFANLVVTTPVNSGAWYGPTTAVANNTGPIQGTPFWDSRSMDGNQCNVGYWLQQTTSWNAGVGARCGNDSFVGGDKGPGALAFLASNSGEGTPVGWGFTASGPNTVTLRLEVAGRRGTNSFGWVDSNGVRTELFAGSTAPTSGAAATKTINVASGTSFGFYLCTAAAPTPGNCNNSNSFSSTTAYSASNTRSGKFALFSEVPANPTNNSRIATYWVGVEDTAGNNSTERWGDYNDMLIRVTVVPEPGFYGALAMGLAGLFLFTRRRQTTEK